MGERIDGGVHDQLLFGGGEVLPVDEGEHGENHVRDALLEIYLVVRDDRNRCGFGTCSACCRHGDDWRVVERVAWGFVQFVCVDFRIFEEERYGFGRIDGGTSPDADDVIGFEIAGGLCGLPYCIG